LTAEQVGAPLAGPDRLPLRGITVVALEHAVAAPLASRHLADLGARVIKVERLGTGDFARGYDTTVRGMSSHFVWLNHSKESVALDLKSALGRDAVVRLLDTADVMLENLAPGSLDRLGLGAATLRERNPALVTCSISGYGSSGPYAARKAYDLLIQCETGVVSLTGTPDEPSKAGIPVADIASGMYAYGAVLAALFRRERTGEGAALEVSMLEALGEWLGYPLHYSRQSGQQPPRTGASHAAIAPYGPYTAADGKQVFLAVQNDREWEKFCATVLEAPQLAEDARFATAAARNDNRVVLEHLIGKLTARIDTDELIRRLDEAGVASARLRTVPEFDGHPQLEARGRWRTVDSPVGPLRALAPPVSFGAGAPMGPVPALGQHTAAVLAEIGMEPGDHAADDRAGATR
jgi:crotonobetainyl-CoA:carnitine CoA-transferase CaiB-like acyl-CoA transferase